MVLPLIDLTPLVLFVLALALCLAVVYVSKAFFGVTGTLLGKLPVVGGWIDSTAHHIEQRITNTFGGLAANLETRIGASWHSFARLVDKIGHEIAAHASLLAVLAEGLPGFGVVARLYAAVNALQPRINALIRRIEGIGHDVIPRVKGLEHGIGHDVMPRIKGLDREITRALDKTIPGLKAGERTLTRDIANLRKWVTRRVPAVGTLAFAGAVAWALSRLGLDWIKCNSAKTFFRKRGCNAWNELDGLLALTVAAVAVEDLRTIVKVLQGVESEAVKGIEAVLKV